jgi:hypothetical protein
MNSARYREKQKQQAEMHLSTVRQRLKRAMSHMENGEEVAAMSSVRLAAEAEASWRRARRRATGKSLAEARCVVPGSVDREDDNLESLAYHDSGTPD